MLNVVTVEVGNYLGRGVEYVACLQDMVRRNLDSKVRGAFIVLTDDVERYKDLQGVVAKQLPPGTPASWWAKMELYNPATFEAGERVLYFDLDTVITGPLDVLAGFEGPFGTLRDVYRPAGLQSSVIAFETGTKLLGSIYDAWVLAHAGDEWDANKLWPGGDQEFLEWFWREHLPALMNVSPGDVWPPVRLQDEYPGQLRSYKAECVAEVPKGTTVVFFHGEPRPHELSTGWVPEVWKVGAGTAVELVMIPNIPQEQLLGHIVANRYSAGAKREWELSEAHDQTAIIVGGAPSLAEYVSAIAAMQRGGCIVLATNGTDAYLRAHGVIPDAHLVVDARPGMVDTYCPGGKKLYSSMCDPGLIRCAIEDPLADLTIWHPLTSGAPELLPADTPLVGGGTTIGVKAMVLAHGMGFRKLLLFGMDSCYTEGAHHAYAQPANDADRVLDVITRGKAFKAAPWMVQQAEDFKLVSSLLARDGVQITVFGEGLIPWIASGMIEAPAEPFTQHHGLWWPTLDQEARPAVLGTLPDCRYYSDLAARHRTCVQAGGNVGVWALELSKTFERVLTFEPDPENFTCLQRNTGRSPSINAYPLGLGAVEAQGLSLNRQIGNCGATAIALEPGEVRLVTLDSLQLTALDLLILDVEGFEQLALMGAETTLRKNSPVIVLELKGLGVPYGYSDSYTVAWLAERGYEVTGKRHRDVIFTKRA